MFRPVERTTRWVAVLALAALIGVQSAGAASLPSVTQVLERHVSASGGRAALRRYSSMTVHGRYQAGDATALFEDYREFGGVLTATRSTTRDGDSVSIFIVTAVTYDDVPDSTFALPDAVRAALVR